MQFRLRGTSDSELDIRTIGERNDALLCVTTSEECCRDSRRGDIYHIRDDVVVPLLTRGVLYRNRGSSVVRLNSRLTPGADVSDLVGVYRCCLPDGCGDEKCIEITLV